MSIFQEQTKHLEWAVGIIENHLDKYKHESEPEVVNFLTEKIAILKKTLQMRKNLL